MPVATETIAKALRIVAAEGIQTEDGVIEACLRQAADRLERLEGALDNYRLRDEVRACLNHRPIWIDGSYSRRRNSLLALEKCINREVQEWEGKQ